MIKKFSYSIVSILFLIFFVSVFFFEKVDVYSARTFNEHSLLSNITSKKITDSEAPIGFKTEYSFTIDQIDEADNCLAFYMIHHYAEVYIDDTLIYQLASEEEAILGQSVTCNWAIIPIYQSDLGSEVRIILTPMFKAVANQSIDIMFGSHYDIFVDCLTSELALFLLSILCLILGVGILIVQFINRKQSYLDIFYLGMLSLSIGLWKLCDLRITPMLLPAHAKAIGYIALGMVPIIAATLLLYTKQVFLNAKTRLLDSVTLYVIAYDIVVLALHLLKIVDFRQSLTLTLIGLIADVILVLFTTYMNRHYLNVSTHSRITKLFVLCLTIGLTVDLLLFFSSGGTASLVCSLFIFFMYAVAIFFSHILRMSRRVHIDALTGLLNKNNWNESVVESLAAMIPTTLIVLDLNALKQINDTYGHDIGDLLISNFATILKNALPRRCAICRWGGDEFAIMLQDVTKDDVNRILETIDTNVNAYNQTTKEPQMSYSVGYATSSDYISVTADRLFKDADQKMYRMKQEWHRKNNL